MNKIEFTNKQIVVELLEYPDQRQHRLNILSKQARTQGLVNELEQWQQRTISGSGIQEMAEEEMPLGEVVGKYDEVVTVPSWDHDVYSETVWSAHNNQLKKGGKLRGCMPGKFIAVHTTYMGRAFQAWFFDHAEKWLFVRATECGGEVLCIFSLVKQGEK